MFSVPRCRTAGRTVRGNSHVHTRGLLVPTTRNMRRACQHRLGNETHFGMGLVEICLWAGNHRAFVERDTHSGSIRGLVDSDRESMLKSFDDELEDKAVHEIVIVGIQRDGDFRLAFQGAALMLSIFNRLRKEGHNTPRNSSTPDKGRYEQKSENNNYSRKSAVCWVESEYRQGEIEGRPNRGIDKSRSADGQSQEINLRVVKPAIAVMSPKTRPYLPPF